MAGRSGRAERRWQALAAAPGWLRGRRRPVLAGAAGCAVAAAAAPVVALEEAPRGWAAPTEAEAVGEELPRATPGLEVNPGGGWPPETRIEEGVSRMMTANVESLFGRDREEARMGDHVPSPEKPSPVMEKRDGGSAPLAGGAAFFEATTNWREELKEMVERSLPRCRGRSCWLPGRGATTETGGELGRKKQSPNLGEEKGDGLPPLATLGCAAQLLAAPTGWVVWAIGLDGSAGVGRVEAISLGHGLVLEGKPGGSALDRVYPQNGRRIETKWASFGPSLG
ncbi:unnamed protein product [Linum trigynum]|uniref:Uncharacterized protein n=1 Tax=Linum trigynum TaxID=586398 RepID=A0AAV2E9I2_9ROSI